MAEKFETQFHAFSKFGDSKSDGQTITLSQSDKWMKQAKVIDGKTCTTTDTGIAFKKFKAQRLSYADYNKFIDDLATTKKLSADNMRKSMTECGNPGTHSSATEDQSGEVELSKQLSATINEQVTESTQGKEPVRDEDGKTPAKVNETVARLTDPKKYTGSSKLRFDEMGKGKGIEGRVDKPDESGYVAGYKHKDTYGKTTPPS